ncbi:MAG: hypothetical protein HUJ91_02820 [Bacteroidales bacterium]|nr:hypothetical protein [Bacteroidales bacterium]
MKNQLVRVSIDETCLVYGGVDKNAQQAIYYIGYIIGIVVRVLCGLFGSKKYTAIASR